MTNIFSKILEKLVHRQVLNYVLENDIINENQFGFLPGKSTHEAIFKIVHHIYSTINYNKIMDMLLLDIAKAFNCIDHDNLFKKLKISVLVQMSLIGLRATLIDPNGYKWKISCLLFYLLTKA